MRYQNRLPRVTLIAGITGAAVLIASAASAQTYQQLQQQNRNYQQQQRNNQQQQQRNNQQQQKQNAADAKRLSAEAADAESKAEEAKKGLAGLNASIKDAQKAVDDATKSLKTVEAAIIDGQSADSDFGKVRDQYRAADQKYLDARKAVKESDEYKSREKEASDADDPAEAVMALKKEFDDMPEISGPRTTYQEIKETYDPLKNKLLEADSKWVDADKDLKDKKKTLDDLNHQFGLAQSAAAKAKALARKFALAAGIATQAAGGYVGQPAPTPKKNRQNQQNQQNQAAAQAINGN